MPAIGSFDDCQLGPRSPSRLISCSFRRRARRGTFSPPGRMPVADMPASMHSFIVRWMRSRYASSSAPSPLLARATSEIESPSASHRRSSVPALLYWNGSGTASSDCASRLTTWPSSICSLTNPPPVEK